MHNSVKSPDDAYVSHSVRVGEMHQHHFVVQYEGEIEEVQGEPQLLSIEVLVFRKVSPEACQGQFRLEVFARSGSARSHCGKRR